MSCLRLFCFSLVAFSATVLTADPPVNKKPPTAIQPPYTARQTRWAREIKQTKQRFIEVETIYRLGPKEQGKHLDRVYGELFPRLHVLYHHHPSSSGHLHQFTPMRSKWTPEKLAVHIMGLSLGEIQLLWEGAKMSREILVKHKRDLAPFVKADVESKKREHKERALLVIEELQLVDFFDLVLHMYETDSELSERAATTLSYLGDPRAIAPMVKKDPTLLVVDQHLQRIQEKQPAHPSIVRLLASQDPGIRRRAAFALVASGDPKLVLYIPGLAQDDDLRVRNAAVGMASYLKQEDFKKVRPALGALLSDSNTELRLLTAKYFVRRKDSVCALTLLSLFKDASISERQRNNVAGMIHVLTGSSFGYQYRSKASPSTIKEDKQTAERFGEWIKENVPGASESE